MWVPFEVGTGTLFQRQTLLLGLEANVARKPRKCRSTRDAQAGDGRGLRRKDREGRTYHSRRWKEASRKSTLFTAPKL